MATPSKRKGDEFERELATYLNQATGLSSAHRAPLSGGGKVGMYGGSDLLGTPGLFIEAKRVERLDFPAALRQAQGNVTKTRSPEKAIVVNRRNRMKTGDSYVLMALDDFLPFYRCWLKQNGYT